MLKKYNAEKELKKIQRKGIYNPRTKVMLIGGVFLLTALLASSYALFSFASDKNIAFNGKATKILNINFNITNGTLGSFATKILSDNVIKTNKPEFGKGYPTSSSGSDLSGLYAAEDDKGISYYFRGDKNKLNNNVTFAGKNWKILRINGDGSIRLILNESIGQSIYNSIGTNDERVAGYTYDNSTPCTDASPCQSTLSGSSFSNNKGGQNSTIKNKLETWYIQNLKSYDSQIAYGTYCNDTSSVMEPNENDINITILYSAYSRLYGEHFSQASASFVVSPTLKCPNPNDTNGEYRTYGGVYKLKIGLINNDEAIMAGYGNSSINKTTSSNFLYLADKFWTMTPHWAYGYPYVASGCANYWISSTDPVQERYGSDVIPVINLKPNLEVTGTGSSSDPYEVKESTNSNTAKVEYDTEAKIKIVPNEGYGFDKVTCTDGQTATYSEDDNMLKITPKKNTTCTINFIQTLKSKILAQNSIQTSTPDFSKASPDSSGVDYGVGLFATQDDDGTSYYFRGDTDKVNNNVQFANKYWKIIRINGDGSIRLILRDNIGLISGEFNAETNAPQTAGYTFDNTHACTQNAPCISDYQNGSFTRDYGDYYHDSTAKKMLDMWYQDYLADYNDKIALTKYCNDTSIYNIGDGTYYDYNPEMRIFARQKPQLTCPNPTDYESEETHNYGGVYKLKIGLITADELNMAGLSYFPASSTNYLTNIKQNIWTMSPRTAYLSGRTYGYYGQLDSNNGSSVNKKIYEDTMNFNDFSEVAQPVINLKPYVTFTTQSTTNPGSSSNPYIIK